MICLGASPLLGRTAIFPPGSARRATSGEPRRGVCDESQDKVTWLTGMKEKHSLELTWKWMAWFLDNFLYMFHFHDVS